MSNEKVEWKSLEELNGLNFTIPTYQRGYRWTTQQMEELLNDLLEFHYDEKQKVYSLQAIEVIEIGEREFEVIDGQQRLTSLWILHKLQECVADIDCKDNYVFDYGLKFDGKDKYNKMIEKLKGMTPCIRDIDKLKAQVEAVKNDPECEGWASNLDCAHLIKNIEFVIKEYKYKYKDDKDNETEESFYENRKQLFGKYGGVTKAEKDYKVIWHEKDGGEDVIDSFTKINATNIGLTEAELVKAMLYKGVTEVHRTETLAATWEQIERELNNDEFWSFFVSGKNKEKYIPRINFLFELYQKAETDSKDETNKGKQHYLSNWVQEKIKGKSSGEVEKEWTKITNVFDTLKDWYNDYYYYHTIGLLTEIEKDNIKLIKELYLEYQEKSKDEFKEYLRDRIRGNESFKTFDPNYDGKKSKADWHNISGPEDINLESIEKKDKRTEQNAEDADGNAVTPTLLLFNIALLANIYSTSGVSSSQRFPFSFYKSAGIQEEHINPARAGDLDDKSDGERVVDAFDRIRMIDSKHREESFKKLAKCTGTISIDEKTCASDLKNLSINELDEFTELITDVYKRAALGGIGNLTLLDSLLNQKVTNKTYSEKKEIVLAVKQGRELPNTREKLKDSIILPGTEVPFLRQFKDAKDAHTRWTWEDREKYEQLIKETIFNYLK